MQVYLEYKPHCGSVGVWATDLQHEGAQSVCAHVHLPHGSGRLCWVLGTSSREGAFQAGSVNHSRVLARRSSRLGPSCTRREGQVTDSSAGFGDIQQLWLFRNCSSSQVPFNSSLISTVLIVFANFCIAVSLKSGLSATEVPSQPRTSMTKPLAQAAIHTLRTIDALTDLSFLVRFMCCQQYFNVHIAHAYINTGLSCAASSPEGEKGRMLVVSRSW